MATFNAGVLEVLLRARDELSPAIKQVEGQLKSTGKSISDFGTGILPVSAAFAVAGGAAVKFATDMNAGMANVATLIPGNRDRVDELKKSVQDMAIATGKSTADLTTGLYQTVSAFGDSAESAEILEIAARAAAAGLAETTDAVNLTSGITKAYGDTSAEAVQKVADLALMTVRLGQTDFPQLASSMGRVTPIAQAMGQSQEDLFAVFATATGVVGTAAEVSTQYRGVLAALMNPTENMTELIERSGFASGKAMLEQRGLVGTLQDVVGAAEASGEPITKYVSSIESVPLALALAGPQADTFAAKLAELGNASGATDIAFGEMSEGINAAGFQFEQMKQQLIVTAQQFGDTLLPILTTFMQTAVIPLVDMLGVLVRWFADLPAPIQTAATGFGLLVAAAGPALFVIGQLITSVGTVVGAIGGAGGLVTAATFLVSILTGPVGIALAIGAVALAITSFVSKEGGILERWFADGAASVKELTGGIADLKAELERLQPSISAVNTVADKWRETTGQMLPEAIRTLIAEGRPMDEVLGAIAEKSADGSGEGRILAGILREVSDEMNAGARAASAAVRMQDEHTAALARQQAAAADAKKAHEELQEILERYTRQADITKMVDDLRVAIESGEVPTVQLAASYAELKDKIKEAGLEFPPALTALMETEDGLIVAKEAAKLMKEELIELPPALLGANFAVDQFAAEIEEMERKARSARDAISALSLVLDDDLTTALVQANTTLDTFDVVLPEFAPPEPPAPGFFGKFFSGFTGDQVMGMATNAIGGMMSGGIGGALNAVTGSLSQLLSTGMNAIIPGLGVLAAPLMDAISNLFSGLFSKKANAVDHVAEFFGVALSEGLAKAIDQLAADMGGGTGTLDAAFRLLMVDAIKEASITSLAELGTWVTNVHQILSSVDEGLISLDQAVGVMAESWLALVPAMEATGGSALDLQAQISDLITRGVDLEELAEDLGPVLEAMLDAGIEGTEELIQWLGEMGVELELVTSAAQDVEDAFADWQDAIGTVRSIKEEIRDLRDRTVDTARAGVEATRDWMKSIGADTSKTFRSISEHWQSIGAQMGWSAQMIQAQIRGEWAKTQGSARDAFMQIGKDAGLLGADLEKFVQDSMGEWRNQSKLTAQEARQAAKQERRDRLDELKGQLAEAKKHEEDKRRVFKRTIDLIKGWDDGLARHWKKTLEDMLAEARKFGDDLSGNSIIPDAARAAMKSFDKMEFSFEHNMTSMAGSASTSFGPSSPIISASPAASGSSNSDVVHELRELRREVAMQWPDAMAQAARHGAQTAGRR